MKTNIAQKTKKQFRGTRTESVFLDKTAATTWASGREQLILFDSSGVLTFSSVQASSRTILPSTHSDRDDNQLLLCQKDEHGTTSHKLTCWNQGNDN